MQNADAPLARGAAAPAAPLDVPSDPRAVSAKEHWTSAAAGPDIRESLLPNVNRATCSNPHFFIF